MPSRHKSHALTLIEVVFLIVVLAVTVSVVIIAFPRRRRSTAFRMVCGSNLASIGKAMLIYANDYDEHFPRAGGPNAAWAARTPNWMGADRFEAYGMNPNARTGGQASISASLYLLVRYVEVMPKTFVCKVGEPKTKPFDPRRYRTGGKTLTDLWDFGPEPPKHVSYAYHMVYSPYELTTYGDPNTALAADRNPWMDAPFDKARDFATFTPDIAPFAGTAQTARRGNTRAHQGDGQNVLFLDSHVEFDRYAYCAMNEDNIYTSWDGSDKVRGKPATFGSVPAGPTDSLLVNDPAVAPKSN